MMEDAQKETAELAEWLKEIAQKDLEVLSQLRFEVRCSAIMIYIKC